MTKVEADAPPNEPNLPVEEGGDVAPNPNNTQENMEPNSSNPEQNSGKPEVDVKQEKAAVEPEKEVKQKSTNPWNGRNILDFMFYCCPECTYKGQCEESFIKHAGAEHKEVSASDAKRVYFSENVSFFIRNKGLQMQTIIRALWGQ